MASLPTEEKYGYDDSRFQKAVDRNFHCPICFNVLKEPRMCRNNEHIFCRCCITEYLNVNSHTCPVCMEDLTVDTLRRAPRLATKYLSELKINCDYSDRGCHEYIRLEELDSHVENCGFAPVKCSNEECEMVINKREIIHHESAVCEYRKVKCHSCVKIEQDVKDMQGKIEKEAQVTKSIKHREKIQTLEALEEENMIKLGPPVKCFAEDKRFLLGKGSMGTSVYVGILEDASEVAVKRMLKESCEDAAENEMRILSLINAKKSPFIVSYRHFVKDNTFIYLIVDLCEQTLDKYFRSQNNLKINGRRMIKEVLTGLKFLHDQGILHRDLKPSNVLVDVEGHMRLADFGISRVLNEDETTFLTHAKGTQGWMAAEVIEDIDKVSKGRFKKKSDIQPAGMIAFFILTKGEHPFGSTLKSYKLMANIVDGNAVNLHNLVDLDAHQFVSRLVCHEMHNRPSAHEALLLPFLDNID